MEVRFFISLPFLFISEALCNVDHLSAPICPSDSSFYHFIFSLRSLKKNSVFLE
jgi:hypothetical protein